MIGLYQHGISKSCSFWFNQFLWKIIKARHSAKPPPPVSSLFPLIHLPLTCPFFLLSYSLNYHMLSVTSICCSENVGISWCSRLNWFWWCRRIRDRGRDEKGEIWDAHKTFRKPSVWPGREKIEKKNNPSNQNSQRNLHFVSFQVWFGKNCRLREENHLCDFQVCRRQKKSVPSIEGWNLSIVTKQFYD